MGPELPLAIPPPIQPPRLCATSSPMDTSNTYRRVSGPQVFICLSGCQIDLALRGPKAWLSASPGNHYQTRHFHPTHWPKDQRTEGPKDPSVLPSRLRTAGASWEGAG